MNKGKLLSVFVALTLGTILGSAYSAENQKPIKSHAPAASEVQGREAHPAEPHSGSTIKSHDPAASEVTGRSVHPDASEGSAVKSHKEGQEHDRGGSTN